jgi:hypothetical protein
VISVGWGSIDAMGYKLLGFAVWQGGKWYVRRRLRGARRNVALAAVATVAIAGVLAAQRQRGSQ